MCHGLSPPQLAEARRIAGELVKLYRAGLLMVSRVALIFFDAFTLPVLILTFSVQRQRPLLCRQ